MIAAILVHSLLALPGAAPGAAPDAVSQPLLPAAYTLSGRTARWTGVIEADPGRRGAAVLELAWDAADAVLRDTSSLTVRVDDRVVATSLLTQPVSQNGTARRLTVALGVLSPDRHLLTLALVLDDGAEICREPTLARPWFTLLPESTLRWTSRAWRPRRPAEAVLAWQRAARPVRLRPPGRPTGEAVAPVLELAHRLADRSLTLTLTDTHPPDVAFVLAAPNDADASAFRHPAARATLDHRDGTLVITGRTQADLAGAVRAVLDPAAAEACPRFPCALGALDVAPPEPPAVDDVAWRLSEAGWPRGWTARGPGEHRLRVAWRRPPQWRIDDRPTLRVPVTLPDRAHFDARRTRVTLLVNARPLGSWPAAGDGDGPRVYTARVPRDLWADPVWTIEVHLQLSHPPGSPCDAEDDDALWGVVHGTAELQVPHRAPPPSIAAFHRGAAIARPLVEVAAATTWSAVAAAIPLTMPLYQRRPDALWRGTRGCPAGTACILLLPTPTDGAQAELRLEDGVLEIAGAPGASPPDATRLTGRSAALLTGRWLGDLGPAAPGAPRRSDATPSAEGLAAVHASAAPRAPAPPAAGLDLATLLAGALLLLLGCRWIWRSWRAADPGDELAQAQSQSLEGVP